MTIVSFSYYGMAMTVSAFIACIALYVYGVCLRIEKKYPTWQERYSLYCNFWSAVLGVAALLFGLFSDTYTWVILVIGSIVLWADPFFSLRNMRTK